MDSQEVARYVVNGLGATLVHFVVLTISIEWIGFESAGFSNLLSAIFGITASYVGSRYYVFKRHQAPIIGQVSRFVGLYGLIAMAHGVILFVWTDMYGNGYRAGFVIATAFQVTVSYLGSKYWVFAK